MVRLIETSIRILFKLGVGQFMVLYSTPKFGSLPWKELIKPAIVWLRMALSY